MQPKQIYLIRHGQTEQNRLSIVQGSGVDSDLNESGRRQAEAFWQAYKDIPFAKVYTSALRRTMQSVHNFIDAGIPHEVHIGLNEISWGEKEGRRVTPEEDQEYDYVLQQWRLGNTHLPIANGESPEQVAERQRPVLDVILSRADEEIILVCMHGRAMRVLLCQMLNYPLKEMDIFEHNNLCLYKLIYTGAMFSIELHNDQKHLAAVKNE
jgi:probable phosphoglycerate mutase